MHYRSLAIFERKFEGKYYFNVPAYEGCKDNDLVEFKTIPSEIKSALRDGMKFFHVKLELKEKDGKRMASTACGWEID